jgi:hypothetical protein
LEEQGPQPLLWELRRKRMRKLKSLIALALFSATGGQLHAQSAAPDSGPPCRVNLDNMKQKIEADYAGYTLEIKGSRQSEYERVVRHLETRASDTPSSGCFPILNELIHWFNDPHLFVYQSIRLDTSESRRRETRVEHRDIDEAAARRAIDRSRRRDPIEGIWYDGPTRMAIMRDTSPTSAEFIAVLLTPDTSTWRAGDIRARFVRTAEGHYDATVWSRNFAMRHLDGTIHKRLLLDLAPGTWGKSYPVLPADSGLLDPSDAERPTFMVRDGTVIVSVPSHDPTYKPVLDSLVAANAAALQSAQRLIIDLRGDNGGSSGTTNSLYPYVASHDMRPDPLDFHRALMFSSPDQIVYAGVAFGPDTSAFVRGLLARLRAHPGGFAPVLDPDKPAEPDAPDSIIMGPARVGLMIDDGTVSAGEVIVMEAQRSNRVTVYGENTAGALDYESTNTVRITEGERRWYLGYPTITANSDIPRGGMRGKGIAPDVRIDWSRIADPIREVERRLTR